LVYPPTSSDGGRVDKCTWTLYAVGNLTTIEGWDLNWAVIYIQDGLESTLNGKGDFTRI